MHNDQLEGLENDDTPKHDAPELIDDVLESEVVRRKGTYHMRTWHAPNPALFLREWLLMLSSVRYIIGRAMFLFCTVP